MTPIRTLTISYSAPEDRLHLALRVANGSALRMWLTQRLARQLVMVLHEQGAKLTISTKVDRSSASASQDEPAACTHASSLASPPAIAEMEPSAAAPVAAMSDAPAWLVQNIVVTIGRDKLRLQFKSELDVVPATFVDRRAAAHWLKRLRKFFLIADWPLDLWHADREAKRAILKPGVTRH